MGIADRNRAATFLVVEFLAIPSIWQFQYVRAETLIDGGCALLGGHLGLHVDHPELGGGKRRVKGLFGKSVSAAALVLLGPLFKMRPAPRAACPGVWLRRWSLDELPQC